MSNPSGNGGIMPSETILASVTGKPAAYLNIIKLVMIAEKVHFFA
jgi:hypothetical protein